MPDLKGKILFIEDDADEGSTLVWDRQMTQLRQIGVFDEIEGLVIGRPEIGCGFTKKDSLEMIVKEATKDYDFPIISEVDFGHTDPMITIPIGIKCRMDTKKKEIEYLESAVL
jgi:muramoyltetrapeptide carboxypeptidase